MSHIFEFDPLKTLCPVCGKTGHHFHSIAGTESTEVRNVLGATLATTIKDGVITEISITSPLRK